MWLSDLFGSGRRNRFFDVLRDHAGVLRSATELLVRFVETGDGALADAISSLEQRGDILLATMIAALRGTFVTPLDRQDLYGLSDAVDDMLDYVNNAAREIVIFRVTATDELRAMAAVLHDAASAIDAAVSAIADSPSSAAAHAREAVHAESRMEGIYRIAVSSLFDGDDLRTALKLREIYRHMSNSADRAEAVGRLILRVVVKET